MPRGVGKGLGAHRKKTPKSPEPSRLSDIANFSDVSKSDRSRNYHPSVWNEMNFVEDEERQRQYAAYLEKQADIIHVKARIDKKGGILNSRTDAIKSALENQNMLSFNADCVRKKANWTKSIPEYNLIDSPYDEKELVSSERFLRDLDYLSPKLRQLLEKIRALDAADMKEHGTKFKHFIFSDVKHSAYGAKMIASGLRAIGMTLANVAPKNRSIAMRQRKKMVGGEGGDDDGEPSEEEKTYEPTDNEPSEEEKTGDDIVMEGGGSSIPIVFGKMDILPDAALKKTKGNNFFILNSTSLFQRPIAVPTKKAILAKFNERPDNIYGDNARIIVMDSGYKEGIDLFDIKYIHIFEPSTVASDQKQVIGRGTRTCGQRGLKFHPTEGWKLHVFIYDMEIPEKLRSSLGDRDTVFDLYLRALNIDTRLYKFSETLEDTVIFGSVDYELNRNVHEFRKGGAGAAEGGGSRRRRSTIIRRLETIKKRHPDWECGRGRRCPTGTRCKKRIKKCLKWVPPPPRPCNVSAEEEAAAAEALGFQDSETGEFSAPPPRDDMTHEEMREYIDQYYKQFTWDELKMENLCPPVEKRGGAPADEPTDEEKQAVVAAAAAHVGGAPATEILKYSPTQNFIRNFFTSRSPIKGMLLYHSVGTGKTCAAIAAATNTFEREGYTILWVTRTTLKNDIWKNMFQQVCHELIREKLRKTPDFKMPAAQEDRMKLLTKAWRIRPMSYKQFSNLVSKGNKLYEDLVRINGSVDPLRKTLVIIDEAHKLYGGADLSSIERPDMDAFSQAINKSYEISGADSVKLLLMTATPITTDPMEMIKLVNLFKPIGKKMPDAFDVFSEEYLTETGDFSETGRTHFLNNITGHISYLNREYDARQFAQPQIERVIIPMVNEEQVLKLDKKLNTRLTKETLDTMKSFVDKTTEEINKQYGKLNKTTVARAFESVACGEAANDKERKLCKKIAKKSVAELFEELKGEAAELKQKTKDMKEAIKAHKLERKEVMQNFKEKTGDMTRYKEFSQYPEMRDKCIKKIPNEGALQSFIEKSPEILEMNEKIAEYTEQITNLSRDLKTQGAAHKERETEIKGELRKKGLSAAEREKLRKNLAELTKHNRTHGKRARASVRDTIRNHKYMIAKLKKDKTTAIKDVKADMKDNLKKYKKQQVALKKVSKKILSNLGAKMGVFPDEIPEKIKETADKYKERVAGEFEEEVKILREKEAIAEAKRAAAAAKKEAAAAKRAAAAEKKNERARAAAEKKAAAATRKAAREEAAMQKKIAALAKKTRKVNIASLSRAATRSRTPTMPSSSGSFGMRGLYKSRSSSRSNKQRSSRSNKSSSYGIGNLYKSRNSTK